MKIVVLGQALIRHPVIWPDALRRLTHGADAVLCNFEGCLPPDTSWPMKTKTVHKAHPKALGLLQELGVTHLALANNHVWDFGHAGILATKDTAVAAGFAVAGAGASLKQAGAAAIAQGVALVSVDAGPTPDWAIAGTGPGINPLRLHRTLELPPPDIAWLHEIATATGEAERKGRRQSVGYDRTPDTADFYGVAIQPGDRPAEHWSVDEQDFARLAQTVQATANSALQTIVAIHYHHWSPGWSAAPDWLLQVSERLIGCGADCIACTGPPVAYPARPTQNGIIAPGLGNLVFHTERSDIYRSQDLPVWRGQALLFEQGTWHSTDVDVIRP